MRAWTRFKQLSTLVTSFLLNYWHILKTYWQVA